MHSSDEQWWNTHSADYVLGLLSTPDRLVFERVLPNEPEIQQLVFDWREKLQPMSDALPPIQPPEYLLPALITNLPLTSSKEAAAMPEKSTSQANANVSSTQMVVASTAHLGNQDASHPDADGQAVALADGTAFMRMVDLKQASVDAWRSFAGLAAAACLIIATLGWIAYQKAQAVKPVSTFDGISVVQNAEAQALWVIDSSADAKMLRVTAVAPPALEQGQAFELWMVKPDDGGVVSMGLLPAQANSSMQFNARRFDADATSFSVSLESAEGVSSDYPNWSDFVSGKNSGFVELALLYLLCRHF